MTSQRYCYNKIFETCIKICRPLETKATRWTRKRATPMVATGHPAGTGQDTHLDCLVLASHLDTTIPLVMMSEIESLERLLVGPWVRRCYWCSCWLVRGRRCYRCSCWRVSGYRCYRCSCWSVRG